MCVLVPEIVLAIWSLLFLSLSLSLSLYTSFSASLSVSVLLSLLPSSLSVSPSFPPPSLCISVHTEQSVLIYSVSPLVRNWVSQFANCASHTHTHTHTTRLKFSWVGLSSWSSMVMSVHSSTGLISRVEAMWCQCTVLLGWSLKLKAASLVMSLYKSRYNTHIAQWHDIPIFRIFSLWVGFWGTTTMNTNTCNTKCSIVH